jgi:ribosome biogenesis GTPase
MEAHVTRAGAGDDGVPGERAATGRVTRLDRGWSTVLLDSGSTVRVRNIGMEVAVGDRVRVDAAVERVEHVFDRSSALIRRNSFEGARGLRQVVAANIDTVFLLHAVTAPPNERRLERELVLAFDSGARPVIVLTKLDAVDAGYSAEVRAALAQVSLDVPIMTVSSRTGEGIDGVRALCGEGQTVAFIGASGVGKSTLVNALVGAEVQRTGEVRDDDQRGRHTTVAAELVPLPDGGWLLDTPGLRAVTLWTSGHGIERAFRDVFDLADGCRFRDCKHLDEPGCAVNAAIDDGRLDRVRLDSMRRLVAEELALEEEQREREKAFDRRGARRSPGHRGG